MVRCRATICTEAGQGVADKTSLVRDSWEAKKEGLAKKISEHLGVEWTIDINPNQIYAYAKDGYAKESPGAMIAA
jgi:hypothetical protein